MKKASKYRYLEAFVFSDGGGAAPPVKPNELGSFLLPMAAAKDCGNRQHQWQSIRGRWSHRSKDLDNSSIPHFTLEPPSAFFQHTTWLWAGNTPSWSTTNSFGRKPVDTKHLGQKQLAARWSISEASLERWRSEGVGPKFLKLPGRVLYRQIDIEAFEELCLSTSTKTLARPVRFE